MLEFKVLLCCFQHGPEVGLGPEHVLEELRHPPDDGVTVKPGDPVHQVRGDGGGQVGRPGAHAVHDGQLQHLRVGGAGPGGATLT